MKRTYSIRTVVGIGASAGVIGGNVTLFEITDIDRQAKQYYLYKAAEPGVSIKIPVSPNLGSTASEFQWEDLPVTEFSGWVTVGGGSLAWSESFMQWASGRAEGLKIKTSGWSIQLPQASLAHGSFGRMGGVENLGPPPANWPIPTVTLAIWHPIPGIQPSQRYYNPHWAFYWGALVLKRFSGNFGSWSTNWQWDWYPSADHKSHLPDKLKQQFTGEWQFTDGNIGNDAVLKFRHGGEFARLSNYNNIVGSGTDTYSNDEVSLYQVHSNDQSNGLIDGNEMLWMVTDFKQGS
jgi:hypothetical protein